MSTTEAVPQHLEDLEVGQRHHTRLAPLAVDGGPGVALALASSDLAPGTELESRWRHLAPVAAGAELAVEATVLECRRTPELTAGVVVRHLRVTDAEGTLVQEGRTTALVPVHSAVDDGEARVGRAFGTKAWGAALAARLDADPVFTTETSTWDGAIGIRYGDHEVQLRIYRGRVLEATSRTISGATFVVEAAERDWVDLFTGPVNDFSRRAMLDQFHARGNAYEYLRLTAALVALVDRARELAGAGRSA